MGQVVQAALVEAFVATDADFISTKCTVRWSPPPRHARAPEPWKTGPCIFNQHACL